MGKTKKKHSTQHHSKRGSLGKFEAIVFPIVIVILVAYFIISKANGDDTIGENYLIFSIVVCMVLMVVSIPGSSSSRVRTKKKVPKGKKKPSAKRKRTASKKIPPSAAASVIEEVEEEEVAPKERKIISYPSAASGGKYGDAYVPISQDMILKVRSLLAVSCKNCKELDSCWEKYQDQMTYDEFLERTECPEKMDPEILSAAPPVQVTEEESVSVTEEEPVVEEEWGAVEEVVPETEFGLGGDEASEEGYPTEEGVDSYDEEDESGWDEPPEEMDGEVAPEGEESYHEEEGEESYPEEEEDGEMAWD